MSIVENIARKWKSNDFVFGDIIQNMKKSDLYSRFI